MLSIKITNETKVSRSLNKNKSVSSCKIKEKYEIILDFSLTNISNVNKSLIDKYGGVDTAIPFVCILVLLQTFDSSHFYKASLNSQVIANGIFGHGSL